MKEINAKGSHPFNYNLSSKLKELNTIAERDKMSQRK